VAGRWAAGAFFGHCSDKPFQIHKFGQISSPKVTKTQKVLATLKRLRFEPLFFPERFSENIKGHGVACKQVGRQAGVSPIVSVRFHYLPSVARDDQFTLRAFPSHSSNSPTNIERLHVLMLVPVHLGRHRTEP
jgi:hypothetical protein